MVEMPEKTGGGSAVPGVDVGVGVDVDVDVDVDVVGVVVVGFESSPLSLPQSFCSMLPCMIDSRSEPAAGVIWRQDMIIELAIAFSPDMHSGLHGGASSAAGGHCGISAE